MTDKVARYGKFTAHEGRGGDLAALLLAAARALADDPRCELYLVSTQADDPDTVWVTELWRSQADLDDTVAQIAGSPEVAEAMSLVRSAGAIPLDLLGGKGARLRTEGSHASTQGVNDIDRLRRRRGRDGG